VQLGRVALQLAERSGAADEQGLREIERLLGD